MRKLELKQRYICVTTNNDQYISTMGPSPTDPVFSVISVYNDRSTLEEMLLESLETENDALYECILLNNLDNKYESAAEALNEGAKQANGEYLLFVHQDVYLKGEAWFRTAQEALDSLPDVGIAGVVGMATEGFGPYGRARNTLMQGDDCTTWRPGSYIDTPEKVQTVDECCFIIPASVFDEYQLDEELCNGWHLYAVEYALRIRERTEYESYVLPVDIWHGSTGMALDKSYYDTLGQLASRYDIDMIYTTCGTWPTNRKYQTMMRSLYRLTMRVSPSAAEPTITRLWPKVWGDSLPLLFEFGKRVHRRFTQKEIDE